MRQQITMLLAALLLNVTLASLACAQFNLICCGTNGDGVSDLFYDTVTGNITLYADGSPNIGLFQLFSQSGIFTGEPANLPADGLFGVDTDNEIAKAAFSGVNELNLGNVAQTGLDPAFLVNDLTTAYVSRGFGFPNLTLELIATVGDDFPPEAMDAAFPILLGQTAEHMFQAIDDIDPPSSLVWSDLALISSPAAPAIAAVLGADGSFSWDTSGSPLGEYSWSATVTDSGGGADTATLDITVVIPEPASALLVLLAMSFCGLVRRR